MCHSFLIISYWNDTEFLTLPMARLEPSGMILRRLYDLPVFAAAGTLSITSSPQIEGLYTPLHLSPALITLSHQNFSFAVVC
ncbi:Yersinia protein of uncharacterised function (DUF3831) [Yersinia enterocolitica]|nr:Yersinia protein of uncharacterised function (DUF3831) [Yersinia enterocolitica]